MGKVVVILVLVGVWCLNGAVGDGITVSGTKCGQKTCKTNEFCSAVHFTCEDCGDGVCDSTSHNYEEAVCEKQCQSKFLARKVAIIQFHQPQYQMMRSF